MTSHRPARLVALDWMLEQAAHGEHESDGPNRSPLIDKINTAAGVPLGSSYCAAALRYGHVDVAGLPNWGGPHAASVGFVEQWARQNRYLHDRPFKGDSFAWKLDGDDWPDHAGMVVRVISWGGLLFTVQTVEANTSSGKAGSQSDGGGWYRRTRTFRRGRVSFVRDPRPALRDPYAAKISAKRRRLTALRSWILKRAARGWTWKRIKSSANWKEYKRLGGR